MAEMVGSAVAQETVSRSLSFMFSKHEEKVSRAHYIERLEMARFGLGFTLEVTNKVPIIHSSLLRRRKMFKRAYEECGDLLDRSKRRVLEDEESSEQGVTAGSSFAWRAFHAVKSFVSSSVSQKNDELSGSNVKRFEWYADEASKFVRDVESGCSLAHYRFISSLVRPLLEGKTLWYRMVQGSLNLVLIIEPTCSEGRGTEAWLFFGTIDLKMPTKGCFALCLVLRLSESTDMVGIAIECLQSLGPLFKSLAQVATGELAQLPAQDVLHSAQASGSIMSQWWNCPRDWRPDPLCCRANAHSSPRANNSISSSEISCRFPEQVIFMGFRCYIPAFDEHNLQISSPDGAIRNAVARNWAPLELTAIFAPHVSWEGLGDSLAFERISGRAPVPINGSLRELEEMVRAKAVDCFIRQPEKTEYYWYSAHGLVTFIVQKPITESKRKAVRFKSRGTGRSKSRRVAKRKQAVLC